jgi:hypothetical protein
VAVLQARVGRRRDACDYQQETDNSDAIDQQRDLHGRLAIVKGVRGSTTLESDCGGSSAGSSCHSCMQFP